MCSSPPLKTLALPSGEGFSFACLQPPTGLWPAGEKIARPGQIYFSGLLQNVILYDI